MERFEQLGFPTVRDEEWKYTNLAPLAKDKFQPASSAIAVRRSEQIAYPETADAQLIVVNGFPREDLSLTRDSERGRSRSFSGDADARYNKIVREHLARNADYHDNGLTALNTAFFHSGVFIHIPKNVKVEKPLQMTFLADGRTTARVFRECWLWLRRQLSDVIESFSSTKDAYFTNAIVEVILKDGARLEHYVCNEKARRRFTWRPQPPSSVVQQLRHHDDQSRRATIASRYIGGDGPRRR